MLSGQLQLRRKDLHHPPPSCYYPTRQKYIQFGNLKIMINLALFNTYGSERDPRQNQDGFQKVDFCLVGL